MVACFGSIDVRWSILSGEGERLGLMWDLVYWLLRPFKTLFTFVLGSSAIFNFLSLRGPIVRDKLLLFRPTGILLGRSYCFYPKLAALRGPVKDCTPPSSFWIGLSLFYEDVLFMRLYVLCPPEVLIPPDWFIFSIESILFIFFLFLLGWLVLGRV